MGLRDIELTLPPGFRFYPSDEELVCHYLRNKVANERFAAGGPAGTMVDVDLHVHEPWELPDVAKLSTNEWYFFSFRDRKYATGLRTNRATKSGYWKATGKDRVIRNPKSAATTSRAHAASIVGMRKTLVFYRGRAPNGTKTCWVMHEFRIENPHTPPKEDWVLCRVFHKKRADTEYAMDSEQEMAGKGWNYVSSSSSCHGPEHQSLLAAFPSLCAGGGTHHYQLPSSHDHHHHAGVDAFTGMPPLLSYDSIIDFSQHLDGSGGTGTGTVVGAEEEGSRNGGGDQCGGLLMDLGLQEEQYNYNSLMQM